MRIRGGLGVLVAVGVLQATACRTGKVCTDDEQCRKLVPNAYCDLRYQLCIRPDETPAEEADAAGFDAGVEPSNDASVSVPDAGVGDAGSSFDGGADAGCRRDDAGCLPPRWTKVGTFSQLHNHVTATVLVDGRVLWTGTDFDFLPQATEIYDPATRSLSSRPDSLAPRQGATTSLLPTGDVLFAGGNVARSTLSAEVFRVDAGTWGTTGAMLEWRQNHTASSLRDGRVLVSGGRSVKTGNTLSTSELYSATGSWSAAAPMQHVREQHSATTLRDGRILVTGGVEEWLPATVTGRSEIYDPAFNSWSPAASLKTPRTGHVAVSLSTGEVLIAGGRISDGGVLSSCELYDPAKNVWNSPGPLALPRVLATALVLPDGRVLVAGGETLHGTTSTSEIYDPSKGIWTSGPSLDAPHVDGAAVVSGSTVVIGGGYGGGETSVEVLE